MLNKIKAFLGMKHEIDSRIFRKALVQYPYNSESDGSYLRTITSVKAFQSGNKVTVTIKTHSPGILIGRKGIQISAIKELMAIMSGKEIEISIIEEEMFQYLYG
jgi:ribosomal protein S3